MQVNPIAPKKEIPVQGSPFHFYDPLVHERSHTEHHPLSIALNTFFHIHHIVLDRMFIR
ncbi:hypothetical protein GLW00_17195 [Halobacillus litoralis]|uniref:Uncharacterized protein n=1 Tax=Halobacillus litoralis TaxID=45668 RepID=A0A845FFL6_9BACI|nr:MULTISPECIES: hypothetical protein [Halobacillus]MEC3883613.1 hypothetical protein [Halobacillus sp. HZG1]MYL72568.1 hypothetical protein [Halobacillus litoralis]